MHAAGGANGADGVPPSMARCPARRQRRAAADGVASRAVLALQRHTRCRRTGTRISWRLFRRGCTGFRRDCTGFGARPSSNSGFVLRPFRKPGCGFRPSRASGFGSCPFGAVFRRSMDTRRTRVSPMDGFRTLSAPDGHRPNPGSRGRPRMDTGRTRNRCSGAPGRAQPAFGTAKGTPTARIRNPEAPTTPRWGDRTPSRSPAASRLPHPSQVRISPKMHGLSTIYRCPLRRILDACARRAPAFAPQPHARGATCHQPLMTCAFHKPCTSGTRCFKTQFNLR